MQTTPRYSSRPSNMQTQLRPTGRARTSRAAVGGPKTHTVPDWGLRSLCMAWDCSPSPSRLGGAAVPVPGHSLKMPGTAVPVPPVPQNARDCSPSPLTLSLRTAQNRGDHQLLRRPWRARRFRAFLHGSTDHYDHQGLGGNVGLSGWLPSLGRDGPRRAARAVSAHDALEDQ